jgi:hypothetical protein
MLLKRLVICLMNNLKLYKKRISIKQENNFVLRDYLSFKKNFYLIYHTTYKHNCWRYTAPVEETDDEEESEILLEVKDN